MGLAPPERPEEPVDDGKTLFEVSLPNGAQYTVPLPPVIKSRNVRGIQLTDFLAFTNPKSKSIPNPSRPSDSMIP